MKLLKAILLLLLLTAPAFGQEAFNGYSNVTTLQSGDEFALYRSGCGDATCMKNWIPTYLLIDGSGNITGPTSITATTFIGALTGQSSTAAALAANGANCSAGNYPLGVDASGAVESCTAAPTQYTDELAQDAIGAMVNTSLTYTDGTPLLALTSRTIGNVAFDGTGNIVPETTAIIDSTDSTSSVVIVDSATGNLQHKTDAGLTYNASTGMLTATGLTGPLTGNSSTATALAANGTNCSSGNYPLGVDASGNVEDCTAVSGGSFDSTAVDSTTWSDGANASNVWTFDVSGTDWTMTIGSALATFSQGVTVSGTTSTPTLSLTGTGTINGLDAVDSTGEDTIEELIFDADAQDISGTWEVQDDVDFVFGNDANWKIQYDEGVDDQLLIATTGTAAIATTDPLLEILVGTTPTADQQVFGVAKGTQATNTELFTVDEDGDGVFPGTLSVADDAYAVGWNGSTNVPTKNAVYDKIESLSVGGDWVRLGSATASTSASLGFTSLITATYDTYVFVLHDIRVATDAIDLIMRTDSDNGASYDSGANTYGTNYTTVDSAGTEVNAGAVNRTSILLATNFDNGAASAYSGVVWIYNPLGTTNHKRVTFQGQYVNDSSAVVWFNGAGHRISTADVDAVQFLASSGNLTSGEIIMYGLKN